MQMGKVNQYFREFVNPRTCNGMGVTCSNLICCPNSRGFIEKIMLNIRDLTEPNKIKSTL
jgi:hypothetical protein